MSTSLLQQLNSDLVAALKTGQSRRAETLRLLLAAVKNWAIAHLPPNQRETVDDRDVIAVLQKQAKQHRESIEAYRGAARNDLVAHEQQQLDIVSAYLPQALTEGEIVKLVNEVIADGKQDFGDVMRAVMQRVAGQADGKQVSGIVREILNSKSQVPNKS